MTDPNIIHPGSRVLIKSASHPYLIGRGVSVGDIMIVAGDNPFNVEEDHGVAAYNGSGGDRVWLYPQEFELISEFAYTVDQWTID